MKKSILYEFFHKQLQDFLSSDIDPVGRRIITCCLDKGSLADYEQFIALKS